MGLAVFMRGSDAAFTWCFPALVGLGVATIPLIQWSSGQIVLAGTAWLATLYVLGLALSLQMGRVWTISAPGEPTTALFGAIVIAAITSTGVALYQWAGLADSGLWIREAIFGRPFANFGQPNQLATFLCWGLLGLLWFWDRQRMSTTTWVFASCFLLFGIALTASRTPWVILVLLVGLLTYWRYLFRQARLPWIALGLAAFFVVGLSVIPHIASLFTHDVAGTVSVDAIQTRFASDLRPQIWRAALDAIQHSPWWGYGWNQTSSALLHVLLDHPGLQTFFSHSHNLALDVLLWMGVPLGSALIAFVLWRFAKIFLAIRTSEDALLFCMIVAVLVHAMLELPLHYAYMLLPTGLAWGVLEARHGGWNPRLLRSFHTNRIVHIVLWGLAASLTALLIRDYARVQASYEGLRYEWARLASPGTTATPQVVLLTQWREFVEFEHVKEMSERPTPERLAVMQSVTEMSPSSGFLLKLATAQAFSDQPLAARDTLKRACQLHSEAQCRAVQTIWEQEAQRLPALAAVPWPLP